MSMNETRIDNIKSINSILIQNINLNYDLSSISRKIERSCFNYSIKHCNNENKVCTWNSEYFIRTYNLTIYKVLSNLDPASLVNSKFLIEQILNFIKCQADPSLKLNFIEPSSIGFLTSEQLCPDKTSEIRAELDARKNSKIEKKSTKMYKCKQCGHSDANYILANFRAADEGSSLSLTCNYCHNHWVQH